MKKIVSFLFICLFFTACGKNFTTIDANKAVELMESENVVVIDVRDKEEYNSGHIANAINIPLKCSSIFCLFIILFPPNILLIYLTP